MHNVTSRDAQRKFRALVDQVAAQQLRVAILRRGTPIAGIVSYQDLQRLEELSKATPARKAAP